MEDSLKKILTEGISEIDNSLCSEELINKLSCLYDQISLFNPAYGLVNATKEELVIRHILDCLAPVKILSKSMSSDTRIADLGSGSGLPGLVLASALSDAQFTLVERMGRRAQFLKSAVVLLGLSDRVRILQSDLSEVKEQFDIVTFRAFRPVREIAKELDSITHCGSSIYIYKSSEENIEEDRMAFEAYKTGLFSSETVSYQVPFLDAKRVLLCLKKNAH